jgi:thiol-disulfide isomerase/thioredoxin
MLAAKLKLNQEVLPVLLPNFSRFGRALACALALLAGPMASQAAESRPAPDFTLPTDGDELVLSSLRGQVVYLDFWASWCTPCRASFPWMNEMQAKYAKQGLRVVAINLDAEPELAQRFLKDVPADFTIAFDAAGKTAEAYQVIGMPSAYLIDRNGRIVESHVGFRNDQTAKYETNIRNLLAQ